MNFERVLRVFFVDQDNLVKLQIISATEYCFFLKFYSKYEK